MDPLLHHLATSIDSLQTESQLQEVIDELEDQYDRFDEIEQEVAETLLAQLGERLRRLRG